VREFRRQILEMMRADLLAAIKRGDLGHAKRIREKARELHRAMVLNTCTKTIDEAKPAHARFMKAMDEFIDELIGGGEWSTK